jgi:hypothetical protein
LTKNILIITAGEDEIIRFWDTSFELKAEINLRTLKIGDDGRVNVDHCLPQEIPFCTELRHL